MKALTTLAQNDIHFTIGGFRLINIFRLQVFASILQIFIREQLLLVQGPEDI